jgi:ABC-type multidrug transport system fused ATPase/permease subunit
MTWAQPYLIGNIVKSIDTLNIAHIKESLFFYALMWFCLLLFDIFDSIANLYAIENIKKNIKRILFKYIMNLPLSFFTDDVEQAVIGKIKDITNGTISFLKLMINTVIFISIQIIVFISLYRYDALLLYSSLFATIFYLIVVLILNKNTKEQILDLSDYQSKINRQISNTISNIKEIKNYGNEKTEVKILSNCIKEEYNRNKKLVFSKIKLKFKKDFSSMLLVFFNIAIIFYLRIYKNMQVEIIVQILSMSVAMMEYNKKYTNELIDGIDNFNITQDNLLWLIKTEEIEKNEDIVPKVYDVKLNGKIEFKDVCFTYSNGDEIEKQVFNNLSITIKNGEKIGLVGYPGSGKTTFIKLLMQHLTCDSGVIIFDDKYNINNIEKDAISKNICYINESAKLFNRSIKDNIIYGNPEADYESIKNSIEESGCIDFINDLPLGINTIICGDNFKLSVGQEKQVIIARILLENRNILIFDDFLDDILELSDKKITNAINNLTKNKTTIVITNNQNTLKNVDMIFVFNDGKITEIGTNDDLLKLDRIGEDGKKTHSIYKEIMDNQKKSTKEIFTDENNGVLNETIEKTKKIMEDTTKKVKNITGLFRNK